MSVAKTEFDGLCAWLRERGGDVDHSTFIAACDKVARLAALEAQFRYPHALSGRGYVTLDYATSLLREYVPVDVLFPHLRGWHEYHQTR